MIRSFNSPIDPHIYWIPRIAKGLAVLGVGSLGLIASHVIPAWGGCNTIPEIPVYDKRKVICQALRRDAGCYFDLRRTLGITVFPREADYDVKIGEELIGTYQIENPEPVVPEELSLDDVNRILLYQKGSEDFQRDMKEKYRCKVSVPVKITEYNPRDRIELELACVRR